MVSDTQTAADNLRAAADYLEQYGWVQGTDQPRKYGSPCCAMIALGFVATTEEGFVVAKATLEQRLRPSGGLVSNWNDEPGRTAIEVIAALRSAADALR